MRVTNKQKIYKVAETNIKKRIRGGTVMMRTCDLAYDFRFATLVVNKSYLL